VKRVFLEYRLPLLVWLAVIFLFSTDWFSSNETSRFIVPLLRFFFPGLSSEELQLWHGVVRKFAHVTGYFILAVLAYRTLKLEHPDLLQSSMRTVALVMTAALLDELHQAFTASRSASILDVGYDGLGAVSALWLITIYETRHLRSHSVL
jgi:VanZ family protein